MPKFISIHIEKRIAYIILNRPEKRNALNPDLISELTECFKSLNSNDEVKVAVLKAKGSVFSAGADLAYLQQLQSNSYVENIQDSQKLKELFLQMYSFRKPLIAQVEGDALAGGCGLISICDIVFSAPDAVFGFTEVKIGFVPALVSVFLIKKIGEGRAKELLLSGELITAETAAKYGLVNFVIERDKIEESVRAYAEKLALTTSAQAIKLTKQLLSEISDLSLSNALELATKFNAEARLTEDCKKGIKAFLDKRPLQW